MKKLDRAATRADATLDTERTRWTGGDPHATVASRPNPPPYEDPTTVRLTRGFHLRAARALLGWTMDELARASGLSLSTIRRLEEASAPPKGPSLGRAVAALRRTGILFVALDPETLALARIDEEPAQARPAQSE